MTQKADVESEARGEGQQEHDDEFADETVDESVSFAEILGPHCSIQRVDKNRKVLGRSKPEDMQREVMGRAMTQRRLGAVANHVQGMSRDQKLAFALSLKEQGNELYAERQFEEAARVYNDSLCALDLDGSAEEKAEAASKLQLPVCTNLAACTIEMACYTRTVEVCNMALGVDPTCIKALYRRGLALYRLGDHATARPDFEAAWRLLNEARDPDWSLEETKAMDDLRRRVSVYLGQIRKFAQEEKRWCQQVVRSDIYQDRPKVQASEAPKPPIDDSDEAIEAALRRARGGALCTWCSRRQAKQKVH